MDGLLRLLFDRDGPSETVGTVSLRIDWKEHRLIANRVTGRSLRRWWQPRNEIYFGVTTGNGSNVRVTGQQTQEVTNGAQS
jgi:hypothetical protein